LARASRADFVSLNFDADALTASKMRGEGFSFDMLAHHRRMAIG
jgi:hypothetical protein